MSAGNMSGWPQELVDVAKNYVTCEFATLTKRNTPVTWPLTPYLGEDGRTVDVSTGLSYPAKAERARRNPKVGVLFSDPVGSGLEKPPVVLVQGLATVRDRDLQAGSDRYVRLNFEKLPETYKGQPAFVLKRQQWYFTRAWILVTPLKVMWWPGGDAEVSPEIWNAPEGTVAPPSDPPPSGPAPKPWNKEAPDWHKGAEFVMAKLGLPVLTVVDRESGFPVPFRAKGVRLTSEGFSLEMAKGMPVEASGPACLTFHGHPEVFVSQQNTSFVGEAVAGDGGASFRVERQLGDFSLGTSKLSAAVNFVVAGFRLRPHLRRELERRGQPMPRVNLPGSR